MERGVNSEGADREEGGHRARHGFSYFEADRGPRFSAWVGTGKRVLDLGCRDGTLTRHYAGGNVVTGVDVDHHALAIARQELGISTVLLDLNRRGLPFDDNVFDVAVAGEVLEHLIDPAAVVREARRVLAPAGLLIGSVPNSYHWRARAAGLRGRSIEDPDHLQCFSRSSLAALFGGFADVAVLPIGGIGGRALPVIPTWISRPLVRALPMLLASDYLFRAVRPPDR